MTVNGSCALYVRSFTFLSPFCPPLVELRRFIYLFILNCVHVIDFNQMHGLQWPALIQALALWPGGNPLLQLTGIGPPSLDGLDSLRKVGLRLAKLTDCKLARSVNVWFAFRGVATSRLEDVKLWMLQVGPKEAVAVNSIMQLHRLLGSDSTRNSPVEVVLGWIRNLNSKIMTVGWIRVHGTVQRGSVLLFDHVWFARGLYTPIAKSLGGDIHTEWDMQRSMLWRLGSGGAARAIRKMESSAWTSRI